MELQYYTLLFIATILTFPFASKRLVFHRDERGLTNYSPLADASKSMRWFCYSAFAVILALMVVCCIFKDQYIADNQMYIRFWEAGGSINRAKALEPSFPLIAAISPAFIFLLFIYAVLSGGTHLYAILRNSPNIWISMFTYLSYTFVLHDMIQIRAAVAAGIFLIAVRYIASRNWKIYFLLCAAAIAFHFSAIVMIPLFFIPRKRLVKWVWITFVALCMILALFQSFFGNILRYIPFKVVEMYLSSYLGNRAYVQADLGPFRVLQCLLVIWMIAKYETLQRQYPYAVVTLVIYIFSLVVYLLFADIPVLQGRIGEMFGIMGIYVWAMFPMINKKFYWLLLIVPAIMAVYYNSGTVTQLLNIT